MAHQLAQRSAEFHRRKLRAGDLSYDKTYAVLVNTVYMIKECKKRYNNATKRFILYKALELSFGVDLVDFPDYDGIKWFAKEEFPLEQQHHK